MNRLQKKCIIATAGFHLLLLVILFVGPAFFVAREKLDDSPVLEMVAPDLVDSATTGMPNAQPPPPAPVVLPKPVPAPPVPPPPQPQPTPAPPEPKPVVEPETKPQPTITERLKKFFKPAAEKPVPESAPVPEAKSAHTPKVNLQLKTRTVPKNNPAPARPVPDNSKAVNSELQALRKNLSAPTTIAPVGNSSVAAAKYGDTVKAFYTRAWTLPDDTASDDANVKVSVTIASDGTVVSAQVVAASGDARVDRSVQNTLDRVQFIAPFPPGSTDKERTYLINFNLKSKRQML